MLPFLIICLFLISGGLFITGKTTKDIYTENLTSIEKVCYFLSSSFLISGIGASLLKRFYDEKTSLLCLILPGLFLTLGSYFLITED